MDKSIIESYPRYERYKDSGVDWLGEIPEDWKLVPGFKIIEENKKKNSDLSVKTVLSLSYGKIVIKPEEKLFGLVPESFETYQVVEPNDLIIRCTDLQNDRTSLRVGLVKNNGMITSAYLGFKVRNGYSSEFLYYYLHSLDTSKAIYKMGTGLRQNLSFKDFKRFPLIDIPVETQRKIVSFINDKTNKIEKAIELKQKQIEKLEEYKQIVIQNAVTKGLNPNVTMKDSGVDWIGEIPEHWRTNRLGVILTEVSSKNHPNLPLLSVTREKGVIKRDIEDYESNHNYIPDDLTGYKKIVKGQFGMNKMKAWQGSYGVSKYTGIISPAYYVFDIAAELNKDFFSTAIRSKLYIDYFRSASDGVRIGQWDLNKVRMNAMIFVIPPIEEQIEIEAYLQRKFEQTEKLLSIKRQEIDSLKEYKTVLINEAVTGKIKVA